jgi:hypothetical protein
MKGLQWTTLPERKVTGTIFAKLDIESIKIDFSEIEAQFAAKVVEIKKGIWSHLSVILIYYVRRQIKETRASIYP